MTVKGDVLAMLEANRGKDVSGQEMAQALGVTRNAVWRAINSLRADGCKIESGTNRGYRLMFDSDVITEEGIRAHLPGNLHHLDIRVFEEVDSTNNEAKRILASGFDGSCLVVALRQSEGRGRRGRGFFSPEGGVYMSLVLQNRSSAASALMMTMASAVSVARSLEECGVEDIGIKWVNDVFSDGKKVCGILTEGISDLESGTIQSLVVGIGINIWSQGAQEALPVDLADIVGFAHLGEGHGRCELIARIVSGIIETSTLDGGDPVFMEDYRERSMVLGRRIECVRDGERFQALATSIDDDGSLHVTLDDGSSRVLHDGEVSLRF